MKKMPKRLTPEKTTFINVGGSMIPIYALPYEISQEFLMIDAMKSEAAQLTYRLEVLSLAIKAKSQDLGNAVAQYMVQQQSEQKLDTDTDKENSGDK